MSAGLQRVGFLVLVERRCRYWHLQVLLLLRDAKTAKGSHGDERSGSGK